MKKYVLIIVLLLSLSAISGLVYVWYKPHKSIDYFQTEPITANTITKIFEDDEPLANKKYLNKALLVYGVVKEVSENNNGQTVILLKGYDEFSVVQCTLKEETKKVQVGDSIKVRGFCNGYTIAVILDDCKIAD